MKQEKKEKLPLDAQLLSEAIIELNISRRCVGLYPSNHPIVISAIDRAFNYFEKLFELRIDITLGITGDSLVVDEYMLDQKNPVFREFALSVNKKGIVAITFYSGLARGELFELHELMTNRDSPVGKDLIDLTQERNMRHISLKPLDMDSFRYIEGMQKQGLTGKEIWEDYIYALAEGNISDDAEDVVYALPPEEFSSFVNDSLPEMITEESYDRIITTYLRKRGSSRLSSESLNKFISFVNNLKPELKEHFLSRGLNAFTGDLGDIERTISTMSLQDMEQMLQFYTAHSSKMPEPLNKLLSRLQPRTLSQEIEISDEDPGILDDIEIDEDLLKRHTAENYLSFVSETYQEELTKMATSQGPAGLKHDSLTLETREDSIDRAALYTITALLDTDDITEVQYELLLGKLAEFIDAFRETGRLNEIQEAFDVISKHSVNGKYKSAASHLIHFFSTSGDFVNGIIDVFRVWRVKDREAAFRLAQTMNPSLIAPLLDALAEESDASIRKFFLSILASLGDRVNSPAAERLSDSRWFVVRNMLYLLRECNGKEYISKVRSHAKSDNFNVALDAVKTLLHFKAPEGASFVRHYLASDDPQIRNSMIRLAGAYKIRQAVPYLLGMLEKKELFGSKVSDKMSVIRTLGDIGDPSALGPLYKICTSTPLLSKKSHDDLKTEIFRSLINYPADTIKQFLELGMVSTDSEIRTITRKLTQQQSKLKGKTSDSEYR